MKEAKAKGKLSRASDSLKAARREAVDPAVQRILERLQASAGLHHPPGPVAY